MGRQSFEWNENVDHLTWKGAKPPFKESESTCTLNKAYFKQELAIILESKRATPSQNITNPTEQE